MKPVTWLLAAAALTLSCAAHADSCLIQIDRSDTRRIQCQEFGPGYEQKIGGATLGEMSCEQIGKVEIDESGKTMHTTFREGRKCPAENLALRCGMGKANGEYQMVMHFYRDADYTKAPRELCADLKGDVL